MRPQRVTRGRRERRSTAIFIHFSPNGSQEAQGGLKRPTRGRQELGFTTMFMHFGPNWPQEALGGLRRPQGGTRGRQGTQVHSKCEVKKTLINASFLAHCP